MNPSRPTAWLRFRVAVLDRVAAVVLLPVLGPAIGVLAAWVHRREGRPMFVGLDRVGAGGRIFRMWKIRSMSAARDDGSAGGSVITASTDRRVTATGELLRRWRLDELPQVLNVLRGDMGLLGPRPETPSLVASGDPEWEAVLAVRPGVAGPTQLLVDRWEASVLAEGDAEDRYREDVLPVKLAADRWYVEHASPAIDLRVLWSMVQRFGLGRDRTTVEAVLRAAVPEAAAVPVTVAPPT